MSLHTSSGGAYQSPRGLSGLRRESFSSTVSGSPRHSEMKAPLPALAHRTSSQSQQQPQQPKSLDLGPLQPFLKPDFDVTAYTKEAMMMSSDGAESTLRSLKTHLETVEHAISSHVVTHEDSLLGTLEAVGALKREMTRGKSDSSALLVSLTRVENEFSEPLERLKTIGSVLRNAHEATGVLRKLGWFLVARKKLKAAMDDQSTSGGALKEASKAAQLVAELEDLLNDGGLRGVTIVDADTKWIKEVGQKVRQDAQKALEKAIVSLNQGEMGMALQAFFHLGILEDRVSMATIWAAKEFSQEARDALKEINSTSSSADANQRVQVLRAKTDALLERSLRSWALRVWNLQRVLTKKRDPTTHVLFSDVVKIDVFELFWNRATAALEQELKTCSRWVREALVDDYARLRRSARAMLSRLWTSTSSVSASAGSSMGNKKLAVGGPKETQTLMQAFHPFLSEFLARSLSRLNQPVMVMFPEEETRGLRHVEARPKSIPTVNDVSTFAQIITKELLAVKGDPELLSAIAKACGVAISLFCEKCEALSSKADAAHSFRLIAPELSFSTSSASAVPISSTARTSIQEHNVSILTIASLLGNKLKEVIDNVAATNVSMDTQSQGKDVLGSVGPVEDVGTIPGMDDLSEDGDVEDGADGDDVDGSGELLHVSKSPLPQTQSSQAGSQLSLFSTKLEQARHQIEQVIADILQEYIGSEQCFRAFDDILGDANTENYNVSKDSGSPHNFCAKFARACKTLREDHLSKLPANEILVQEACTRLCLRLMKWLALRACCVRPLNPPGKRMLVRDVQTVAETILSLDASHGGSASAVAIRKELSGVETLLGEEDEATAAVRKGLVRRSLAWHYLFASAPGDVHSPHTRANMTLTQYIGEIENATDDRIWPFISACLAGKTETVRNPFLELAEL